MIWRIREFFTGVSNFWKFRREVYRYRSFDYEYSLDLLCRGLMFLAEDIQENDAAVNKEETVSDIMKAVYCLQCMTNTIFVADIQAKCDENVTREEVGEEALKNLCRILTEGDKGSGGIKNWWT